METARITAADFTDTQLPVIGPDFLAAKTFLDILHPHEKLCFQAVPRTGTGLKPKFFYGYLDDLWDSLVHFNMRGADIYCMVNQYNGRHRSNHSITAITSFFVSVHNAPVDRVAAMPIKPHVIVMTGPNSWQAHWRVQRMPVTQSNRGQARGHLSTGTKRTRSPSGRESSPYGPR